MKRCLAIVQRIWLISEYVLASLYFEVHLSASLDSHEDVTSGPLWCLYELKVLFRWADCYACDLKVRVCECQQCLVSGSVLRTQRSSSLYDYTQLYLWM